MSADICPACGNRFCNCDEVYPRDAAQPTRDAEFAPFTADEIRLMEALAATDKAWIGRKEVATIIEKMRAQPVPSRDTLEALDALGAILADVKLGHPFTAHAIAEVSMATLRAALAAGREARGPQYRGGVQD